MKAKFLFLCSQKVKGKMIGLFKRKLLDQGFQAVISRLYEVNLKQKEDQRRLGKEETTEREKVRHSKENES